MIYYIYVVRLIFSAFYAQESFSNASSKISHFLGQEKSNTLRLDRIISLTYNLLSLSSTFGDTLIRYAAIFVQ